MLFVAIRSGFGLADVDGRDAIDLTLTLVFTGLSLFRALQADKLLAHVSTAALLQAHFHIKNSKQVYR